MFSDIYYPVRLPIDPADTRGVVFVVDDTHYGILKADMKYCSAAVVSRSIEDLVAAFGKKYFHINIPLVPQGIELEKNDTFSFKYEPPVDTLIVILGQKQNSGEKKIKRLYHVERFSDNERGEFEEAMRRLIQTQLDRKSEGYRCVTPFMVESGENK